MESLHSLYQKNNFLYLIPNWFVSWLHMILSPIFLFYSFVCLVFIISGERVYAIVKLIFLFILFYIKTLYKRRELESINEKSKKEIPCSVYRQVNELVVQKDLEASELTIGDIVVIKPGQYV